jgi:GGDEF domain-containing protein
VNEPHPSVDSEALVASQAAEIRQRLVSQAQQNVDEVLRALAAQAPPAPTEPESAAARETFSRKWSELADVLLDPRTGLASRILFWDRLRHAAARYRRHKLLFGVLYVRTSDDKEAHVPELARRLGVSLREIDTVGYAGGGEFTVLLDGLHAAGDARAVAERIQRELASAVQGGAVPLSASIGVAVPAGNGDAGTILWQAYVAMQRVGSGAVGVAPQTG